MALKQPKNSSLSSPEKAVSTSVIIAKPLHRTTMYRRARGKIQPRDQYINNASLLTKQQQLTLVNEINRLTDHGLPPTNAMVRNFAMEIAKKRPGKNWVYRFVDTHSKTLKSGFLSGLDLSRKKADNTYQYALYFQLVCGFLICKIQPNVL
jgi:Tc5 transposase DNA-binding domain